ncbi:MAG: outer membrane lipoprotein-sorting protein [Chthoniobacterales bacterium]|nr:outer membrane lipoprotein-sorting protein [Chthoniobacterales bacterium]
MSSALDASSILRDARLNALSQSAVLDGVIRQGTEKIPFQIFLQDSEIRFHFNSPPETYTLRLGEDSSELLYSTGTSEGRAANLNSGIRGTPLTAIDLSLSYLYWPNPRYLGQENVRSRPAHLIELNPPNQKSPYGVVRVWIDQQSGALLRMEGYDWDANLVKRFEIISAQKIQGQWFLKNMRVEAFAPGSKTPIHRAYLEVERK